MIEGFNSKEKMGSDWDTYMERDKKKGFDFGAERIVYSCQTGNAFNNSNPVSKDMSFGGRRCIHSR